MPATLPPSTSLQTAIAQLVDGLQSLATESTQLREERQRITSAALTKADLLQIITGQVDRAAAWWTQRVQPQIEQTSFGALKNGTHEPPSMYARGGPAEPFVLGLFVGSSPLCFLMRDQLLAGYKRMLDARDFSAAGMSIVARERALGEIDARLEEIRNQEAELHKSMDLAGAVEERLSEARQGAFREAHIDVRDLEVRRNAEPASKTIGQRIVDVIGRR